MGTIYAVRNDRMGARLGVMLNAKRVADDFQARFRFIWPNHENVSPELQQPEMLFSENFLEQHWERDRSFGDLQTKVQAIESLPYAMTSDDFRASLKKNVDYRCVDALRAVGMPWENQNWVAKRVSETLETIEFAPRVEEIMAEISARLGGTDLVAYHLRRGDIIDPNARPSNVLWPDKYLPRVFYEAHILRVLEEDPNVRIVIFSDAEHEIAAFTDMSERVFSVADLMIDEDLHVLQRDFIELYLMSRCRRIIGPGASAFSCVAATVGNGRIVDVRADLTATEHDDAMAELTYRLDKLPEVFAGNADIGQNFPEFVAYHRRQGTEKTSRRILQQHLDNGFNQSYIYDLLAEQYFDADDADGALKLIETLRTRPILTDLGNAASYVWAGLTALSAGRTKEAAALAHIGHWFQPNSPVSRILMSTLVAQNHFDRDNHYPVPQQVLQRKIARMPKHQRIAQHISAHAPPSAPLDRSTPMLYIIPFELEVRDWAKLQTIRLPASFMNHQNQLKMINFFQSSFKSSLDDPAIMSMLGQLYCQAQEDAHGIPLIEKAYAADPADPFINIRLARLRSRQKKRGKADRLYDEAANLSEGQICFRAEQGIAKLQHNGKKGALEIFTELAEIDHQMIEVMILTADILRRAGKHREQALAIIEKADRLAPGALRITQLQRKILSQLGRDDEADQIRDRLRKWKRAPGKFSSRI